MRGQMDDDIETLAAYVPEIVTSRDICISKNTLALE
jgi:hypothetical protein